MLNLDTPPKEKNGSQKPEPEKVFETFKEWRELGSEDDQEDSEKEEEEHPQKNFKNPTKSYRF